MERQLRLSSPKPSSPPSPVAPTLPNVSLLTSVSLFADQLSKVLKMGLLDECVIRWDALNKPFEGCCGWEFLDVNAKLRDRLWRRGLDLLLLVGIGMKHTAENCAQSFGKMGWVTIDLKRLKIWADPIDPWACAPRRVSDGRRMGYPSIPLF